MSGPEDIWRQAADKFGEVLAQVGEDQWDAPTPCEEWTVRELVDHAVHWQALGGQMLGAATAPGDDWAQVRPAVSAALDDPRALEGTADDFGGMPKHQMFGLLVGDVLVHSWDLARAIGADDTLPPAAVEATLMGMTRMGDQMRQGSAFADPVEIPDDASAQDRLIAFSGRQP